jgi:hypothetical protein
LEERGQRAEASSRIVIEEEDIYKKEGGFSGQILVFFVKVQKKEQ